MDTTGAVDLGAVRPSKAATTEAPQDTAPGPVRAVREAMEAEYDAAVKRRQATMAVIPIVQMARAAITAMGGYPSIPDYEPGAARETRYRDARGVDIDPEEFYVPSGGELPPEALPEVASVAVWAEDGHVTHRADDPDDGVCIDVELTPQQAIEYHLAGLAAAYAARDLAGPDVASHETTG